MLPENASGPATDSVNEPRAVDLLASNRRVATSDKAENQGQKHGRRSHNAALAVVAPRVGQPEARQ
jgi:hypothetical protein